MHIFLFVRIQTCKTGGQQYSPIPPTVNVLWFYYQWLLGLCIT